MVLRISNATIRAAYLLPFGPRGRVGIAKLHLIPSLKQPVHVASGGRPGRNIHLLRRARHASHARAANFRGSPLASARVGASRLSAASEPGNLSVSVMVACATVRGNKDDGGKKRERRRNCWPRRALERRIRHHDSPKVPHSGTAASGARSYLCHMSSPVKFQCHCHYYRVPVASLALRGGIY